MLHLPLLPLQLVLCFRPGCSLCCSLLRCFRERARAPAAAPRPGPAVASRGVGRATTRRQVSMREHNFWLRSTKDNEQSETKVQGQNRKRRQDSKMKNKRCPQTNNRQSQGRRSLWGIFPRVISGASYPSYYYPSYSYDTIGWIVLYT
eukprot:COSAG02_NODE_5979_length_3896_cov_1.628127_4_plen_148_part_00